MLKTTQNLDIALRHLKFSDKSRVLWIDAVYIDQSSDEEKNHQVRQMYDIYHTAERVHIWLGKSDEDIEETKDFLWDTKDNRLNREKPLPGLVKIYNRPWFSRVWVIWEVYATKIPPLVLCGDLCFLCEAVNTTLSYLANEQVRGKRDHCFENPQSLFHFSKLPFGFFVQDRDLESLLEAACGREASDSRGYIYALIRLVNDPQHEFFDPDYTKSESPAYQKAMVSVCKSSRDLEWLLCACAGDPTVIPSWCIDFLAKTRLGGRPKRNRAGRYQLYAIDGQRLVEE